MTYDLNITFDDNLVTGNKTIDTQHKELIDRIQNFVIACQNGDSVRTGSWIGQHGTFARPSCDTDRCVSVCTYFRKDRKESFSGEDHYCLYHGIFWNCSVCILAGYSV